MRRPSQEEERQRQYSAHSHSPTHGHPYSSSTRNQPPSPQHPGGLLASGNMTLPPHVSPRLGASPSPKLNGPPQHLPPYNATPPSTSTRYDPLADHREPNGSRKHSLSQTQSPIQVSVTSEDSMNSTVVSDRVVLTIVLSGSGLPSTLQRLPGRTYSVAKQISFSNPITLPSSISGTPFTCSSSYSSA